MCEIYVKADPILYESRSRSLRIHGAVSKIRLENLFWDILAELAAGEGMTTNQLIAKLYNEIVEFRGEVDNFSSFLRVTCLRYLTLDRAQVHSQPRLSLVERIGASIGSAATSAAPRSLNA
ncbi:MAG TPA: ribbon-helix-helix domain-containing protein [Rhodocyclaceae bacterium]|jgi:predicted DNA-binding ribbon-helix-helix protein